MPESNEKLAAIAANLLIGEFHRHVFLCLGDACCAAVGAAGAEAAWAALKDELKARNLSLATGPAACYRTKVGCLRVCAGGPILVAYPEGTWYANMTADRIPRFVQEHLVDGGTGRGVGVRAQPAAEVGLTGAARAGYNTTPPPGRDAESGRVAMGSYLLVLCIHAGLLYAIA